MEPRIVRGESREEAAERERLEKSKGAPAGWTVWDTHRDHWCARPPGKPAPETYIHAESREAVIAKAWERTGKPPPARPGVSAERDGQ